MTQSPASPFHTCPECGAALDSGSSCQEIFDSFLVLEFMDPAYGAVHMLTVACFMIQHRRYSDEALVWIEHTLRAHLEQGIAPAEIRQQVRQETSSSQRVWKVMRQAGSAPLPVIPWSLTIADVAASCQDAESYCALIRRWARLTIVEMQPWLSAISAAKR